jgi:hypothetical protein
MELNNLQFIIWIALGSVSGFYGHKHFNPPVDMKSELSKATNSGKQVAFSMGCTLATERLLNLKGEKLEPMYVDWCIGMSGAYLELENQ